MFVLFIFFQAVISCCCEIETCGECESAGCSWCASSSGPEHSYCTSGTINQSQCIPLQNCGNREIPSTTTIAATTTTPSDLEFVRQHQYCAFRTSCNYCIDTEGLGRGCGYCHVSRWNSSLCTIQKYCSSTDEFVRSVDQCPPYFSVAENLSMPPESVNPQLVAIWIAIAAGSALLLLVILCLVVILSLQRHASRTRV
jgi:hypothetical protein